MATDAPESVRVQCASCGGRFRVRRRRGGALPDAIRCPRCESVIALADEAGPGGWVETRQRSQRDRQTRSRRAPKDEPDRPSAGAPETNDHTRGRRPTEPSQAEQHGDSWEFQTAEDARESGSSIFTDDSDVESGMTTVDRSGESTDGPGNPNPAAMPSGPQSTDSPARADQDGFESGSSRIEKLENVDQSDPDSVMTPLPANSIIEDEPDVGEERASDRRADDDSTAHTDRSGDRNREPSDAPVHSDSQPEAPTERPPSATAIAEGEADLDDADPAPRPSEDLFEQTDAEDPSPQQAPAGEDEEAPTPQAFDWETGEHLYIRVDEGPEREVTRDELLTLLREGVWTDAVEVRPANASTWIALRRHPVWDDIRDELVGHSRQIMLEGAPEQTDDTADDTTQPAAKPQQPEAPSPHTRPSGDDEQTSDTPGTDADSSSDEIELEPDTSSGDDVRWYRSALIGLLVVVVLLALALTALLLWVSSAGDIGTALGWWNSGEPAQAVVPSDAGRLAGNPGSGQPDAAGRAATGAAAPATPSADEAGATTLASRSVSRALDPVTIGRGMLEAGHPKVARWHALSVLARGEGAEHAPSHPSARQLERAGRLFRAAVRTDEQLRQDVVTIGEDVEPQKLHALGGGWSVSFRFTRHGRSIWAFKPAQKDWEEGWKAEIAAWRFCEVVACHFRIPRNRPARISRTLFERLYGRVDDRDQKAYRERFDALIWRTEKGPSGEKREYLYGTLKDWVPAFAKWPIEYKSTWRPWLAASSSTDRLEGPVDAALQPLRDKISDAWWQRIHEQLDDATTRGLARQISSLMVFDYVTTNWDRFSNFEEYYGVNNQFADGHFVSIDNGAAFAYNNFGEVMARFSEVQRYSRRTIASLRALEPEVFNPILFPDPTERGEKRLNRFWNQRSRLLERIADLKEQYGAESVMYFD